MSTDPPSVELSGSEVHAFDQAWATSNELLSQLVESYRVRRRGDAAAGIPEPVTIVGLSSWLAVQWQPDAIASALACAVVLGAQMRDTIGE